MGIKMSIALLVALCAGCGSEQHNIAAATYSAVGKTPTQRDAGTADPAVDTLLIERECYAYSECRTTAHGLGVLP
jgi:hypothetical protein